MQKFKAIFPHETKIRIPMAMVDPGDVVYHSRYLELYHEARDSYMEEAGYDYSILMKMAYHLAVVEANLKFRKPVRYLETIRIKTRIEWIRKTSIKVKQELYRSIEGQDILANEADIILVCIGPDFNPTNIPEDLVKTLSLFQEPSLKDTR